MVVEGEYKENCLFAGLAIYQNFREEIRFCSNRSFWNSNITNRTTDTKHTISPFDDMSLVIYAIKNYTTIVTTLIFNLSTCNGVAINPCEYYLYCGGNYSMLPLCKSYLDSFTTTNTEFKLEVQNRSTTLYESLHKILSIKPHILTLKPKIGSCAQIYFSSSVRARTTNIFQDRYHIYFLGEGSLVIINPEIDTLKNEIRSWVLHSTYVGKINRLEIFHILGKGILIEHHLHKITQKQEKYRKSNRIVIEEKDFQTKYKVVVHDAATLRFGILSIIKRDKDTKVNKIFLKLKGGSYSSVLISLFMHQLEVSNVSGILSTLTSWQMFNIMSSNYIVPFKTIDTEDKTNQSLNILTNLNSVPYGYSLYLEIKAKSFPLYTNNAIVANLKLQTKFCIFKCSIRSNLTGIIFGRKNCKTLVSSDISDTKGLIAEIYDNHCTTKSTLDWSMDLYASDLLTSGGVEVLLPGIYAKAQVHFYYHNYSIGRNEDQLIIKWQDKKIVQRVNTSLLLNGKQYYIFYENMIQRKVYSWKEANEHCIKYGSNLPIFGSQSDVQDLVDIILRAAWTGPMRMIFIGLQVRSICIGRSKGGTCGMPRGLNSFIFMQFLGKFVKIVCCPLPPQGKSWIHH